MKSRQHHPAAETSLRACYKLAPLVPTVWTRALGLRLVASLAFRLACYAVMLWLALWAESWPAPTLPDRVLDLVPYVPWVDRYNYLLWVGLYVPLSFALLFTAPERFIRYTVSAGLVALLRGLCIVVTGLGPVRGPDVNAGIDLATRTKAFWDLTLHLGLLSPERESHLSLGKDLFFSGHTATTFLLLLYVWRYPRLRWPMLVAHVLVVASVFLSHLHYTIDVLGAYAVVLALFAVREGALRGRPEVPPPQMGLAARVAEAEPSRRA
jgi:hypothetical protein